ncbi:hypothetical protein QUV83_16225 [Cellulomonas cellasea]|uniref:hypothetical protein n=1 Tax=Cellulomonas cellasea TaxID=43670 RepID=UPI0025A48384|nr:hypothetical protein [Cellulomonas cellasea]MDM8086322.1 hypothetical protein [Cellulomonas cellasea]
MSTRTLYAACTCVDWSHMWPSRRQWWPTTDLARRDGAAFAYADVHYVRQTTTVELVTEVEP